ncbi:MAG: flagellar basal body P-ring formation protein FlgA [Gammaproteobacteria bacterium]|nr:flagellar basal body P-ring formation protein FlgA [Gammaproteobacteria bacterium]
MRHAPSKSRHRPLAALAALAGLWLATPSPGARAATGVAFETSAALATAARTAAVHAFGALAAGQRLQVGVIAPGMQLRHCARPVDATPAPGVRLPNRIVFVLQCTSPETWRLYVPVTVVGVTPVVVAAHAIVAGTVLTARDLTLASRNLTGLPPGYLDSPTIAIGLTAARPVAQGEILTNQMLLGNEAVTRGERVTLVAKSGGISVRMAGRALADGFVNQRVRVENLSSGKVVEGIARANHTVRIFVP